MATQKTRKKLTRKFKNKLGSAKKKFSVRKKKVVPRFKLEFVAHANDVYEAGIPFAKLFAKIYDKRRGKYLQGFWEEEHAQAVVDYYNKQTKKKIPFPYEESL